MLMTSLVPMAAPILFHKLTVPSLSISILVVFARAPALTNIFAAGLAVMGRVVSVRDVVELELMLELNVTAPRTYTMPALSR